jgi:hypothetical protein
MPILTEAPTPITCHRGEQPAECVLYLKEDHQLVWRRLRAFCLALTGDPVKCGTEP